VPSHIDPHDPRFELDRQDNLALLALGEPVDADFDAHQARCQQCQHDLAQFSHTVHLARESTTHRTELDAVPSPAVWAGIAAETGGPQPIRTRRLHRMRWRTGILAAAAVLIAALGVGTGVLIGHRTAHTSVQIASTARLNPFPGGPPDVSGQATIHTSRHGQQLSMVTTGLPLRNGYYEVWFFNEPANKMVAVGTLAGDGTGVWTLPDELDLRAYNQIDVSAQNFDGNPAHSTHSVLRGSLTR
jgi:Anti-sigma-K factor rskA